MTIWPSIAVPVYISFARECDQSLVMLKLICKFDYKEKVYKKRKEVIENNKCRKTMSKAGK